MFKNFMLLSTESSNRIYSDLTNKIINSSSLLLMPLSQVQIIDSCSLVILVLLNYSCKSAQLRPSLTTKEEFISILDVLRIQYLSWLRISIWKLIRAERCQSHDQEMIVQQLMTFNCRYVKQNITKGFLLQLNLQTAF